MILRIALIIALLLVPGIASPKSSNKERPVDVVVRLYHDYAFESVIEDPIGDVIWGASPKVWAQYFSPKTVQLYSRVEACKGACGPELDPIWNTGDTYGATGVQIKTRTTKDLVDVTFHWPRDAVNPGPEHLVYHLVRIGSDWRISDIEYSDGTTLVGRLKKNLVEDHHAWIQPKPVET